jgi:lysophospholipase L1-like esterase
MFASFRNLRSFLAAASLLLAALPSVASPQSGAFKAGDRWCAVGDSITHGGHYHSLVYLFYATRFPSQRFEMFNCGISGDNANGTNKRLEKDILSHQPTVATVMLGMNDVRRHLYVKNDEQTLSERQKAIDDYVASMRTLLDGIRKSGSRLVLITPSIFDQTAILPGTMEPGLAGPDGVGVNTGLGLMAAQVRAMAAEMGADLIDFHKPMTELNAQLQKKDPAFTLVGPDRIHPGIVGHMVMAHLFLKAQGLSAEVSTVVVDAAAGKLVTATNGTVEDLKAEPASLSFKHSARALPYPVASGAKPALEIIPFQNEFNQELLQIRGLKSGDYELKIDGRNIARFSAGELSSGINLAGMEQTPQYQQAMTVLNFNDKRRALISERLRNPALVENAYLVGEDIQPGTDVAAILDRKLEPIKSQPYYVYLRGACDSYLKYQPLKQETLREVAELTDQMWQAAVPTQRLYEIVAVP